MHITQLTYDWHLTYLNEELSSGLSPSPSMCAGSKEAADIQDITNKQLQLKQCNNQILLANA
jgi:hypothetical protein